MRTVLFVCTGNTCRSPMAEAIARHQIEQGALGPDPGVFTASAGVMAGDGSPISIETIEAVARLGIESQGHSTSITPQMVLAADLVLCMTEAHAEAVRGLIADDPAGVARVSLLDPCGDVEDPIGMGQQAYDALAKRMMKVIPARLEELLQS